MTTFYRQKLVEAAQALVDHGELNMRLTHAAGALLQIDDGDVPAGALARFEGVRDPLIGTVMVMNGAMVPRDLDPAGAKTAAMGILDLLTAEMAGRGRVPDAVDPEQPVR